MPDLPRTDYEANVNAAMSKKGMAREDAELYVSDEFGKLGYKLEPTYVTDTDVEANIGAAMQKKGMDRPTAESYVNRRLTTGGYVVPHKETEPPPGQETVYAPDTSVEKPAFRLRSMEAPPSVDLGVVLDAPFFPVTGAYGGLKGAAAAPGKVTPGAPISQQMGEVLSSIGKGAVGESPFLSEVVSQAGAPGYGQRVSEGEAISDINKMVTGSELPEWSKRTLDVATGAIGLTGVQSGLGKTARALAAKKIALPVQGEFKMGGVEPSGPATAAQLAREEPIGGLLNKPVAEDELSRELAANRATRTEKSWPPVIEPADVARPTQTLPAAEPPAARLAEPALAETKVQPIAEVPGRLTRTMEAAPEASSLGRLATEETGTFNPVAVKQAFQHELNAEVKPAIVKGAQYIKLAKDGFLSATSPMSLGKEAEATGMAGRGALGKMNRSQEMLRRGLKEVKSVMEKQSEQDNIVFMQAMDSGQTGVLPPEMQKLAGSLKELFDAKVAEVRSVDPHALQSIRESYFPHIWAKKEEGEAILSSLRKRPLEGAKSFKKHRVFDDVLTGISEGYKPVSANPIDLVALKIAEMDRYIMDHRWFNSLKKQKLAELVMVGKEPPKGMVKINDPIATVYGPRTENVTVPVFDSTGQPNLGKSNVPIYGRRIMGEYYATPEAAQVVHNYLSKSLYQSKFLGKPFEMAMAIGNSMNQAQLGAGSVFHAGFTVGESMVSQGALGLKQIFRGDIVEGIKNIVTEPANIGFNLYRGAKLRNAWLVGEGAGSEMGKIAQMVEMAGGGFESEAELTTKHVEKMMRAFKDKRLVAATLRSPFAALEVMAKPIMEKLVPVQKAGVFAELAADFIKKNPKASLEEMQKAANIIWNRVDTRLGQVRYNRLFMDNALKNAMQIAIRAPGWTGGTIIEIGGGAVQTPGKLLEAGKAIAGKGKWTGITDQQAYILSLAMNTALANGGLTYAFTGEMPTGLDWVFFRTGKLDEKGHPERFMLPTYAKDVYAYYKNAGLTLMHKTHPMLGVAGDIARNKNYQGTEIYHPGDSTQQQAIDIGGHVIKAFVPFWIRGALKIAEREGAETLGEMLTPTPKKVLPLIGVMPAPATLNRSKLEEFIDQHKMGQMPQAARTKEAYEKSQLENQLRMELRSKTVQAKEHVLSAIKDGKISRDDAMDIYRSLKENPLVSGFKKLPIEKALDGYKMATPEERKKVYPYLVHKMRESIKTKPGPEFKRLYTIFKELRGQVAE